jgi:16S rRNA U516 pseudouridylate synthase RsuA-like enzyme
MRLKRMAVGPIILGRLASGKSRPLRAEEVERLRQSADRAARQESHST